MVRNKAEDVGGLSPAKENNAVTTPFLPLNLCHFIRQLLSGLTKQYAWGLHSPQAYLLCCRRK